MSRRSRLSREELEVNEALSDSESGDGLPPAPGQSVRRSSPASVRSRVATPPPTHLLFPAGLGKSYLWLGLMLVLLVLDPQGVPLPRLLLRGVLMQNRS